MISISACIHVWLRITIRMVLLWMIATVRYAFVLAEQPGSSCMLRFPYLLFFKRVLERLSLSWQQTFLSRTQVITIIMIQLNCYPATLNMYTTRHRLSNMGVYGSPTLKPSRLFGSWSGSKHFSFLLTGFQSINPNLVLVDPRPGVQKMHKRTSKKLRARLAEAAKKSKDPLVKKTINKKTGKVQVSGTWIFSCVQYQTCDSGQHGGHPSLGQDRLDWRNHRFIHLSMEKLWRRISSHTAKPVSQSSSFDGVSLGPTRIFTPRRLPRRIVLFKQHSRTWTLMSAKIRFFRPVCIKTKNLLPKMCLEAPFGWRHAALGDLKVFLEQEAMAGRFKPQFKGGLDLKSRPAVKHEVKHEVKFEH